MTRKPIGFMQLAIICGFSLFYAWYLIAFFDPFMIDWTGGGFAAQHMGQVVFFASSIVVTAMFLGLFRRANSVAIGHTRFLYLASLIPGSTLPASIIASSMGIHLPLAVFYAVCFLTGASVAIGFMLWEDLSKHGYLDRGVVAHGIIFSAGGVMFLVCSALFSLMQNAVIAELLLCANTALLAFITPRCDALEDSPAEPASTYFRAAWHLDIVVSVLNIAFGYAFMMLYWKNNVILLVAMGAAIAVDLIFSIMFSRGRWILFAGAVRICAAAVSCALIAFAHPGGFAGSVALCIIVAFWFIFRTINGGSITDLANRNNFSALYSATRGKLPANIGFTVGLLAGVGAIALNDTLIIEQYIPLTLVALFILTALFLLPFDNELNTAGFKSLTLVEMHEAPNRGIERICEEAAKRYKLSPRELETLVFLVKGRNAKHISNKLFISESTAKTHISNIYRKIGVHSQQELLDAIDMM